MPLGATMSDPVYRPVRVTTLEEVFAEAQRRPGASNGSAAAELFRRPA